MVIAQDNRRMNARRLGMGARQSTSTRRSISARLSLVRDNSRFKSSSFSRSAEIARLTAGVISFSGIPSIDRRSDNLVFFEVVSALANSSKIFDFISYPASYEKERNF